ncbi:hypothetical protein B0H10DRAFT_2231017 [Mycena sp. CBHHK59/15]|nr:hypothetical protein B0H10DRAFT_2231017 [Mycena sp. CBHHK59/15]
MFLTISASSSTTVSASSSVSKSSVFTTTSSSTTASSPTFGADTLPPPSTHPLPSTTTSSSTTMSSPTFTQPLPPPRPPPLQPLAPTPSPPPLMPTMKKKASTGMIAGSTIILFLGYTYTSNVPITTGTKSDYFSAPTMAMMFALHSEGRCSLLGLTRFRSTGQTSLWQMSSAMSVNVHASLLPGASTMGLSGSGRHADLAELFLEEEHEL